MCRWKVKTSRSRVNNPRTRFFLVKNKNWQSYFQDKQSFRWQPDRITGSFQNYFGKKNKHTDEKVANIRGKFVQSILISEEKLELTATNNDFIVLLFAES